ncbi:hypothetical protein ES703_58744 [subsurface metagenome]
MLTSFLFFTFWILVFCYWLFLKLSFKRRCEKRIQRLLQLDNTDWMPWDRRWIIRIANQRMNLRLKKDLAKDKERFRQDLKRWGWA